MSGIRFVICVDIAEEDLTEAYRKLHEFMDLIQNSTEAMNIWEGWESTDEAFGPDGAAIDPDVLQQARMKFFEKSFEEWED